MMSAFTLAIPLVIFAEDKSGWRVPTKAELSDVSGLRKDSPTLYSIAKADFDGDGKEDEASLLINDKENKMGLFVKLTSRKESGSLLLEAMDSKTIIEVMGIDVVKPGKYKTACGKGYWDCKNGEPELLELKYPVIDFFRFESANSYFIWDKKKKKFNRIWMSD